MFLYISDTMQAKFNVVLECRTESIIFDVNSFEETNFDLTARHEQEILQGFHVFETTQNP